MTLQPSPTVGFGDLMDMVTDFGIESLRVGSYEARKALVGCDDWKLSMLRDKRQEARERIAKALYAALASQAQPEQPKQDSVHLTSDAVVCAYAQPLTKESIADIVRRHLTATYHCTRVWEAWHVGTMSEDDFMPAEESTMAEDIADALLAALPPPPAQGAPHG